jgi:hypothetical protein
MTDITNIEKVRQLLRQLQTMLFDTTVEKKDLFTITTEMEKYLDKSSIDFNKLINK